MSEEKRYDLQTLEGISRAREEVFNDVMAGHISEQRGIAAEKMLRGQQGLKGELPLKFLRMITSDKRFNDYAQELAQSISGFVNGRPALHSGN